MFLFLIFIGFLKHKSNTFVEEEEKKGIKITGVYLLRSKNFRHIKCDAKGSFLGLSQFAE